MHNIKRITIKSCSGYCPSEDAYSDKISLTPSTITYACKSAGSADGNVNIKWSYKSDSKLFSALFDTIAENTLDVLDPLDCPIVTDVGTLAFQVTLNDNSRLDREFSFFRKGYQKYLSLIREMIPPLEKTPRLLDGIENL